MPRIIKWKRYEVLGRGDEVIGFIRPGNEQPDTRKALRPDFVVYEDAQSTYAGFSRATKLENGAVVISHHDKDNVRQGTSQLFTGFDRPDTKGTSIMHGGADGYEIGFSSVGLNTGSHGSFPEGDKEVLHSKLVGTRDKTIVYVGPTEPPTSDDTWTPQQRPMWVAGAAHLLRKEIKSAPAVS